MALPKNITHMRDPANPSGGIFIDASQASQSNPAAIGTGSQFFSANVAGQWQVVNAKGATQSGGPYTTEQLAANAAASMNSQTAPVLDYIRV